MKTLKLWFLAAALASACAQARADELVGHTVVLDNDGKLLSWVTGPAPYARIIELAWNKLKAFPVDPHTGLKPYFTYPRYEGTPPNPSLQGIWWAHNPAGLTAMLVDSALDYYAYSGDHAVVDLAREMADHQLEHGMTASDWSWPNIPFASANPGQTEWSGGDDHLFCGDHDACGRGDGPGIIEPDKVGEFGYSILRLYEHTGDARYRDAAIHAADALARHVRAGDDRHSPWPFRVDGKTGTRIREEYSSNVIGPIKLFDEIIRLKLGDERAYRHARKLAWFWMMKYPMRNHHWQAYFEDIPIFKKPGDNPNQYSPLETIKYILKHPEYDRGWKAHALDTLDWVRNTFGVDVDDQLGMQYGAEVMSEQGNDMAKMGSHTSRYAETLALYYARTGDTDALERGRLSFNWATYMCSPDGVVKVGTSDGEGYWFSDGYGDYMRHFLGGMAAVPEWAPANANHLLSTTSVARSILYTPKMVTYSTFDSVSSEVFKLTAEPARVLVDGAPSSFATERLADGGVLLRVRRKRDRGKRIEVVTVLLDPPSKNSAQSGD